MKYLGNLTEDQIIDFKFSTHEADGTPITLAGTPVVKVYKGNATDSEVATGVTLSVDFDGVTGLHNVRIDTSAAAFYAVANDYSVVITTGTVDGVSVVGTVLATFSIENRFNEALLADGAHGGTAATLRLATLKVISDTDHAVVFQTTAGEGEGVYNGFQCLGTNYGQYTYGDESGQVNVGGGNGIGDYGQVNSGNLAGQHNIGVDEAGVWNEGLGDADGVRNTSIAASGQYNSGATRGQYNQGATGQLNQGDTEYGQYNVGTLADILLGGTGSIVLYTDPSYVDYVQTVLGTYNTTGVAKEASVGAISTVLTGITSLAAWLRGLYRKDAMNATAKSEVNSGGGTFSETTDSLESQTDSETVDAGVVAAAVWATTTRTLTGSAIGVGPTVGRNQNDLRYVVFLNGTIGLYARVLDWNGTDITQAGITSIAYTIYTLDDDNDRTAVAGHTAVALVKTDVVWDTVQSDAWASNWNFKLIPVIATSAAFAALGNVLVEVTITPTTGQKIIVRFRNKVI